VVRGRHRRRAERDVALKLPHEIGRKGSCLKPGLTRLQRVLCMRRKMQIYLAGFANMAGRRRRLLAAAKNLFLEKG
jgi:hypothetical protein